MTSSPRYWFIFLAIITLLLLPIWAHSFVPLVDLPLHMARAYAYHAFDQDPIFAAHLTKSPHWMHNAAAELLVSPLLSLCSLERATQWFLTLYILLFAAGCHILGCAVRGTERDEVGASSHAFGSPHPAMLPCLFLSYHSMYLYGYVSFSIGLAAVIFTLGLRIGWASRWTGWRVAVLTVLTTVTYLFHLSAVALLGFAWGIWTLSEWKRRKRLVWWDAASFLAFLPAAVLYLQYGRSSSGGRTVWPTLSKKLLHLLAGFTSYSTPITAITVLACLTGLTVALWVYRRSLAPVPLLAAGAVFTLFAIAPDEMHSASDVDVRFVPLAFVLLAATPPAVGGRLGGALLGLVLAGFTLRQVDIIGYSYTAGGEMEQLLPSLDVIERHALVYTYVWLDDDPVANKRSRHLLHYSALVLPRRHARYANLALVPPGTWPLQGRHDFRYGVFIPPGGSFTPLAWSHLRSEPVYFWTYGLRPTSLNELRPFTRIVYEAGPVRVFRVEELKK